MTFWPVLGVALVLGSAAQPLTIRLLTRYEVLDRPNARSSHSAVVPRGGGMAIVLVVVGVLVVQGDTPAPVLVGLVGFGALGAVDDIWGLGSAIRLVVQVGIALGVAALLAPSWNLPFGGVWSVLLTGSWIVVCVNVFNFMDGINGISSLQVVVVLSAVAGVLVILGAPAMVPFCAALVGSAAAFLPFNAVRARVFLGDCGSYSLGAALALGTLGAVSAGLPAWGAASVLAVYLTDVAVVLVRRAWAGESLVSAHREHVYQRLAADRRHLWVALLVTGLTAIACVGVVISVANPERGLEGPVLAAVVLVVTGYLALPRLDRHARSNRPVSASVSAV